MKTENLYHIAYGILGCLLYCCCSTPASKTSNSKVPAHYMPTGEQLDSAFTELYPLQGIEGILDTNAVIVGNSEEKQKLYRQSLAKVDGIVRTIASQVKQYDDQPVYWVELDRSGFHKILLELNGIPLAYVYTGKHPEFRIDILNQYIEASGEQDMRLRVYTSRGDFFRGRDGSPSVRIGHAADKRKGDDAPQYLTDYITLPDCLMDTGAQYWDTTITFHARVPWDHSHRLKNAVDLRTLPDLEERVLRKYEALRQNFVNCDVAQDLLENKANNRMACYFSSLYKTEVNEIKKQTISATKIFNPNHEDKMVYPVSNYELALYRSGKIAFLRNANDKDGVIRGTMLNLEVEPEPYEVIGVYMLYLPEGETELQVY